MTAPDSLRALPSVHELLEAAAAGCHGRFPRNLIADTARQSLVGARHTIRLGKCAPTLPELAADVAGRLQKLAEPSLRSVINATGVVLHTNLGRAPLGSWQPIAGYSNLEYDVEAGARGKRDTHLGRLLEALLGAAAIAVNNGAAATFLALNELAAGHEVIVSRGELIEIGDGFRIPDILAKSGAILREVGATNRTRIEDYRDAINPRTRLLLRVHPSNFQIVGFTAKPSLQELAALAKERAIPLYEDLGSGNLIDLRPYGISEPLVTASLAAGVNLVSFSCDKLLGGPQAGLLAGDREIVQRLRRNPLFRALRLDKLIYQSLEATLRNLCLENWEAIPALRMIRLTAAAIGERAARLLPEAARIAGESVIGGGSTPDQRIPTTLIVAACRDVVEAERQLRSNHPPVIARIANEQLLLDLRTVFPEEEPALREAVRALPQ